ncbi:hypothetical protein FVEG_14945 [Fusarium verticillioides 7600]|uniref:Uncharacterized protein n=1 Tax=Gibberella moniliformis (strain M3125 / FGSC 7600) TaxID=334819 RepID=W7LTD2_GIBM7|nr:hypothetical protein FVEG_14945 [Fusarium verticillioides 7600]XP_018744935.1 hypothetical protein FVEG_14945 [Fusarium verticillioides 7600]EWG38743.1 hypothetical protein FVEG_14945 [Fusarium verticillioides 7600]EWG38744.1 hypothetical protein FVEG_14945 [Fusarium verticillioides 7600]
MGAYWSKMPCHYTRISRGVLFPRNSRVLEGVISVSNKSSICFLLLRMILDPAVYVLPRIGPLLCQSDMTLYVGKPTGLYSWSCRPAQRIHTLIYVYHIELLNEVKLSTGLEVMMPLFLYLFLDVALALAIPRLFYTDSQPQTYQLDNSITASKSSIIYFSIN